MATNVWFVLWFLFLSVTTSAAGCKFALLTPFLVNTDGRQDAARLILKPHPNIKYAVLELSLSRNFLQHFFE